MYAQNACLLQFDRAAIARFIMLPFIVDLNTVRIKDANTVHCERSHCTLSRDTLARAATLQHSPHAGWNNTGAPPLRYRYVGCGGAVV